MRDYSDLKRLAEAGDCISCANMDPDQVLALIAENESFKTANSELSETNVARRNHLSNAKKAAGIGPMDDLVGAIEALRKDAERYRWLRDNAESADWEILSHQLTREIDRRIDSVIAFDRSTANK